MDQSSMHRLQPNRLAKRAKLDLVVVLVELLRAVRSMLDVALHLHVYHGPSRPNRLGDSMALLFCAVNIKIN